MRVGVEVGRQHDRPVVDGQAAGAAGESALTRPPRGRARRARPARRLAAPRARGPGPGAPAARSRPPSAPPRARARQRSRSMVISRMSRIICSIARVATSSSSPSVTSSGCGPVPALTAGELGEVADDVVAALLDGAGGLGGAGAEQVDVLLARREPRPLLRHQHLVPEVAADPAVPHRPVEQDAGEVLVDLAHERRLRCPERLVRVVHVEVEAGVVDPERPRRSGATAGRAGHPGAGTVTTWIRSGGTAEDQRASTFSTSWESQLHAPRGAPGPPSKAAFMKSSKLLSWLRIFCASCHTAGHWRT